MEICGYTYSFFRQLENRETTSIDAVKFFIEQGLRSVEIADSYVAQHEFQSLRDLVGEAGIRVACYDISGEFCRNDRAIRRSQLKDVQQALERAALIAASYVLLLPGPADSGVSMATAREWYIEGLRESILYAKDLGLTITIANLGYQADLCGTSEHIRHIAAAIGPDLRVTYDIGNFLMAGERSRDALERVRERVVHVHLKDWRIESPTTSCLEQGGYPGLDGQCYHGVPLGDGVVKLAQVVNRLRQLQYDGALSVEYEGTEDPKPAILRGIEFLGRLLAFESAGA